MAIRLYRAALERDEDSLEARWKLLRAQHYLVDFSAAPEPRRQAVSDAAVGLAEDAVARLEDGRGAKADRARLYFWSAIAWGARAQRVGLLTLVREGVATRMHDYAERALALDASVDRGGPLRLLSRLHADLPRVPFVSGWVDRSQVLPLAERAHALDPEHPGNRLILALALLEQAPVRRREAEELLSNIADIEPAGASRVEYLQIREQARDRLQELEAGGDRTAEAGPGWRDAQELRSAPVPAAKRASAPAPIQRSRKAIARAS